MNRPLYYVQLRDGYYYLFWYNPTTKRTSRKSLQTSSEEAAKSLAPFVYERHVLGIASAKRANWIEWARRMCKRAKENAKAKGRVYDITPEFVASLIAAQDNKCAVTGYPFSTAVSYRNPFAPSLDQIQAGGGYVEENVRVVLMLVNTAMNMWGPGPLLELFKHVRTTGRVSPLERG